MQRGWVALAMLCALLAHAAGAGAITYRSTTSFHTSDSSLTTVVLTRPSGVAANDVLLAVVTAENGADLAITPPSGWALVRRDDENTNLAQAVYWKKATASEPGTYSWALSEGSKASGGILAYQGVDSANPVAAASGQTSSGSSSATAPSVTTARPNSVLVGLYGIEKKASFTPPAGMTERFDTGALAGENSYNTMAAELLQAAAEATGDRVATAADSGKNVGQLVALNPPRVGFVLATSVGPESTATTNLAVALSASSSLATTVSYAVTGGTATGDGVDYALSAGILTIPAGATSANVAVAITDDAADEPNETFAVTLSSPANAVLDAVATHTYTIVDDDLPPRVDVAPYPVRANGTSETDPAWGGWTAEPGAANVTSNYLKLINTGGVAAMNVTLDFTDPAFAGASDPSYAIPIDGNVRFAWWEDATPVISAPSEGTFVPLGPAAQGSLTVRFTGVQNVIYIRYEILSLPDILAAQTYSAAYTVTEV